MFKFFLGRMKV